MIFKTFNGDLDKIKSFNLIAGNENKRKIYCKNFNRDLNEINNSIHECIISKNYEKLKLCIDLKMKYENEFVTLQ